VPHLKIVIQTQQCELMLEMDPEVHVFYGVHHDVDELHARHLQDTNNITLNTYT